MKRYQITVNGLTYDVAVKEMSESDGDNHSELQSPKADSAKETSSVEKKFPAGEGISVTAPMPGTILKVTATVGDSVEAGQPLMVLEAMKMENDIVAPKSGKVTSVLAKQGDAVKANDLLATIAE